MKVFLTGATGFIGQALVRAMRQRGWEVTALVRDQHSAPSSWLMSQGVALVPGDVTERAGLREAMSGADVVVHNAGVYELGLNRVASERMQQVNVEGTDTVLGAALEAGIARTIYVSAVWALGPSGRPPEKSIAKDETQKHDDHYLTLYERSKTQAHQVAMKYRTAGLPMVIAIPNGVVGVNDHSVFGYFLRLYLLGAMPPMSFGKDTVYALVDVNALAIGLCLCAEKAPIGQDYVFCGEPTSLGELFSQFSRFPGGRVPKVWLPRWLMRPQMALMEPLLRAFGLPAFLSRDTVDASKAHLNYSSAKAKRELGWTHISPDEMWSSIIPRERELMFKRQGFVNRLKHLSVTPD